MLLTDLLMRLTLLLPMIGGKGQFTSYFQFLHILAPGLGSSGEGEIKFIAFRNTSSLNMTTRVCAHADPELYTRG